MAALRNRYQEVFSEKLGTITPFQAKLSVAPNAKPKFFKPRTVPFALKERVESELDRLERDGVLEKTPYSEWAAPIVTVPKQDGQIRICGDYKVTINPKMDVDQYPLPKPEVRVMSATTASATLDVLREWFAVHGIPEQLVTDNGTQFTSELFEIFAKQNGIKHIKSAPYHPASNGLAERFIQSLKQSLKASVKDGCTLIQRLSSYLLSYRTTTHSTTGVSP